MYYNDFYDHHLLSTTNTIDSTWIIVSAVLALVGGIVAYVMFVSKKNKGEYSGFIAWLHDFLNFKKFFVEVVLKVLYLITALFITLSSFSFISVSIASFFLWLVFGNIFARLGYEFVLMFLTLVSNTTEINKKLSYTKKDTEKVTNKTKKKEEDENA